MGAYRWVKGEIEGAQITQLYRNIYIPYSVSEASTKIRFERKENTLHCVIKIDTEGEVLEYSAIEDQRLFDRENIRRLEKGFAEAIEEEVKNIVQKMQTEFRIDIFGWERELKKRHYELWKQYQGNWEETYENLPVTVEANVHIRRIGGIK